MKKKKGLFRLLASLFCAGMMGFGVFAMFGNIAYAASTNLTWGNDNDPDITLSYEGEKDGAWTANYEKDKTVVGSVQSTTSSGCAGTTTTHYESTLSITCNFAGNLYFEYEADKQGGTINIDGDDITNKPSPFTKENVSPGDVVKIYIKSNSTSSPTKITITKLELKIPLDSVTAHFVSNPNCVYKAYADGNEVAGLDQDIEGTTDTEFSVKVISISEGYKIVGWSKNGVFIDGETYSFKIKTANEFVTLSPYVIDENSATFEVDGSAYFDLQLAIDAAKNSTSSTKLITLKNSGSVFPKEDGSDYVLDGINLFVPGDSSYSFKDLAKEDPDGKQSASSFSIDQRLNLKDQVTLVFSNDASLVVGSTLLAQGGDHLTSYSSGKTGEIDLDSGSQLVFENGTHLYCWGFVAGEGEVTMKNGSKLHELFQFYWRGGSNSMSMNSKKKSFLFNQYYIQNVEANLRMEYGSFESCLATFVMWSSVTTKTISYVGKDGMFVLDEGSALIRKYDAKTDRIKYQVEGNGSISHIVLSLGISLDSANFSLPIASNMDLEVCSGTVQILQNLDLIPGVNVSVDEGATLKIVSNYSVTLYDSSNWYGKHYATNGGDIIRAGCVSALSSKDFSASGVKRTENKNGATITVEGTIQVSGDLFSTKPVESLDEVTKSGRVLGKGKGVILFSGGYSGNAKSVNHIAYQFDESKSNHDEIACTTANLVHGDGTFFEDSATSTQLICYQNEKWSVKNQGSSDITITYLNIDGTTQLLQKTYTIPDTEETLPTEKAFTNFQGKIFLWLEKDNETTSYAPGYKINQFKSSITLVAFTGGWYTDLSDTYYYDSLEGKVTGLYHVSRDQTDQTFYFSEDGALQSSLSGIINFDSKTNVYGDDGIYYLENGVVSYQEELRVEDVPVSSTETKHNYYYFGKTGRAVQNKTLYLAASKLNGLLAEGTYTFGSDSKLNTLECSNFTHVDEVTLQNGVCYYGDIKAGIGLFESDGHIYYAKDDGSILKDATYYVVDGKLNGQTDAEGSALKEGLYYFDSNGYLCDSSLKPISKEAQA